MGKGLLAARDGLVGLLDPEQNAPGVDIGHLQRHDLGDAQPGFVGMCTGTPSSSGGYNTQRLHTSLEGLTAFTFASRSAMGHNHNRLGP